MTDGGVQPQGREPRERVLAETPVTAVGRGSRGLLVVTLLVIAAFAAGLLRPWDLLAPGEPPASAPAASLGSLAPASAGASVAPSPTSSAASLGPGASFPDAATVLCGYPSSWRTMSRVSWAGRLATVWMAADAVVANGPDDPAIPYTHIGDAPVTGIGWCAPIGDDGRPPRDATATLFVMDAITGHAVPAAFSLLAPLPSAATAMAQLWGTPGSRIEPWPGGRYVIRFATPSGTWVRYMGLDVAGLDAAPAPSGTPTPLG